MPQLYGDFWIASAKGFDFVFQKVADNQMLKEGLYIHLFYDQMNPCTLWPPRGVTKSCGKKNSQY